jgi:hypothetical protein
MGKRATVRFYCHKSYEESLIEFENIFRQRTGLEWKTKEKKAKGWMLLISFLFVFIARYVSMSLSPIAMLLCLL